MKKLTLSELKQLERLARRAGAAGQLIVGCQSTAGAGFSVVVQNADFDAYAAGEPVNSAFAAIHISEKDWLSVNAMRSRAKAKPRKLSSEDARAMALCRHKLEASK